MARVPLPVLARLYLGMIFFAAAGAKLIGKVDFTEPMSGFLTKVALVHGYGWYGPIVRTLVLPNAHLFAILVLAAEASIAVCMLFGLATRAAAVVAVFVLLNYACAKGEPVWSPGSNDFADIVLALIVLFSAAGRTLGIDKSLHERFPRVPFW